jgi:hypothetical protein
VVQVKELYVPFDEKGNMLTYSQRAYPEIDFPDIRWHARPRTASWKKAEPFPATLRITRFERGRSAAHFIFIDDKKREYTMFGKFLIDALQSDNMFAGWLHGRWNFAKRGANYSIVKI